jgi:uncharacterized membrane protein YoaK (UPF0700 family)
MEPEDGMHYVLPLTAFAARIFIAERIESRYKSSRTLHWRQIILLIEIVMLSIVGFMTKELNMLANMMVSFSCAMQVQTFRKVHGYGYASTMCIGNLRAGTVSLSKWIRHRDREDITKALYYLAVIVLFGIGAGLGSLLMGVAGLYAILASCILLMAAFTVILIGQERR